MSAVPAAYRPGGRGVSGLRSGELSRARRDLIGFVFQTYNLLPGETALANAELPAVYDRLRPVPGTREFALLANAVANAVAYAVANARARPCVGVGS